MEQKLTLMLTKVTISWFNYLRPTTVLDLNFVDVVFYYPCSNIYILKLYLYEDFPLKLWELFNTLERKFQM